MEFKRCLSEACRKLLKPILRRFLQIPYGGQRLFYCILTQFGGITSRPGKTWQRRGELMLDAGCIALLAALLLLSGGLIRLCNQI